MNRNEFAKALEEKGIHLDDHQLDQFELYLKELKSWNEKMNLTAITEDELVWEKHFLDSLLPFASLTFETLCDVGSGAGFPGIPAAIAWPDRHFTLVEPLQKRCRFLNHIKDTLHLDNVTIVNERAEDYAASHREAFDVVSARAVARLSILLELCMPLVKTGGIFAALKGRSAREELKQAGKALKELSAVLKETEEYALGEEGERINFYFEKEKDTNRKYPRSYSMIKKKPLEG